jgi:Xaa-Pro dipeptidase
VIGRRTFTAGIVSAAAAPVLGCDANTPRVVSPSVAATAAVGEPAKDTERDEAGHDAYLELRGFCDGVAAVDAVELGERRALVATALSAARADALVVEAGTNLEYLTGLRWRPSERPVLGILAADGTMRYVAPAFEHHTLMERLPPDAEVIDWAEHTGAYADAGTALRRATGEKRPRVLLDPDMRAFVSAGLNHAVPRSSIDIAFFTALRAVKTPQELARMRRANEATKASLALVAPRVNPGMRESEVATMVREAQLAAGLQGIWVLSLAGPNAAFPHGTRHERVIEEGDLILVDTGGSLHGYQSDITRTWAVGKPSEAARRAYDAVHSAQARAFEIIHAGVAAGDVDAAARAVISEAGFGAGYSAFTHRLGHGIGMRGHEDPYLVKDSPTLLRPGMTFSNEPGVYLPGELGVRIEDIFAVTEGGADVFGPLAGPLDDPFRLARSVVGPSSGP